MRSNPTLCVACALVGVLAVGLGSTAFAQPTPESAPAASQNVEAPAAQESSRRARRRAQEAPPASAPAAGAAAADKPAGDGLVCRSIRPSGTRLPQRVCHTQQEWDALTEASQEDMRKMRDRSRATGATPR